MIKGEKMFGGNQPIFLLKEGTTRERGSDAQKKNIAAAKAIGDAVRTTLGPKGMDKMLVDSLGDVVITNDGATILSEIDIVHPAAKMVVEVAESQDDECGDGTTSVVVLSGEFLKHAEDLIEQSIHPSIIAKGFRMASIEAQKLLEENKIKIDIDDQEKLIDIAKTAMTGKAIEGNKNQLAEMVVQAIKKIANKQDGKYEVDIDNIKVEKKAGASVENSEMINGLILDKERLHNRMPKEVKNAKIALLNSAVEIKETEMDAEIEITNPEQLQQFLDEEEETIKRMVKQIKDVGANVLFCQKGIDDLAQHYLAKEGIFAIRRVKKSDIKKLAKATGGNIVTNLKDLEEEDLGKAGIVHEKHVADTHMTFVEDAAKGKSVSLLLRGGTSHVVDELERAMHDALKVVAVSIEDEAILPGGGAIETELKNGLEDYADTVKGREQLAIRAYASALSIIPRTLAGNAGMDGIDVLMELTAAHEKDGKKTYGIEIISGEITDMVENHVIEPFRVKEQAIQAATEVANMILRIDDVIASKGHADDSGPDMGGAPGGMGGMGGMPPGMM